MLLRLLKTLELPPNPLDEMIDKMGGINHVAELTGRQVTGCAYLGARGDFKLQTGTAWQSAMWGLQSTCRAHVLCCLVCAQCIGADWACVLNTAQQWAALKQCSAVCRVACAKTGTSSSTGPGTRRRLRR